MTIEDNMEVLDKTDYPLKQGTGSQDCHLSYQNMIAKIIR